LVISLGIDVAPCSGVPDPPPPAPILPPQPPRSGAQAPAEPPQPKLLLDGKNPLGLEAFFAVSQRQASLDLSPAAWQGLDASCQVLQRLIDGQRRVYGVSTGYGPLACQHILPEAAEQLQRNLIYHLASGVGPEYSLEDTRAILAARILSLSRGHSAIRPATMRFLLRCLEADLLPCVPQMGTVGASGDLTPLAHLALGWLGEGEVHYQGRRMPAASALAELGLSPLSLTYKEGLALVNGTSAMTAVAARNAVLAARALDWALRLSCAYAEVLSGKAEAWDARLTALRPHPGQVWAAERLRFLGEGSSRLEAAQAPPTIRAAEAEDGVISGQPLLQDPYSIRCLPQIYGAVSDLLAFHANVVSIELNSVTDNPVFFAGEQSAADSTEPLMNGTVLHGGNFFGQHVAFASDSLHLGIVQMGVHLERTIARLTDPTMNQGLPAFLQPHRSGLQSGFMGAQVTASALVAEMRSEAMPASIQSIPTNANNQDIVPMGTIAARKTRRAIEHLYRLLAIEALVVVQAMELRSTETQTWASDKLNRFNSAGFGVASTALAQWLRQHHPALIEDRPLGAEIEALSRRLQMQCPEDLRTASDSQGEQ
jgi:tyrosine ammonia-lyase